MMEYNEQKKSGGRRPEKRLFYTVGPTGGLVFAEAGRVLKVAGVYRAIEDSRTWGEFRKALPLGEYERIAQILKDCGDGELPDDSDVFNAEMVPGFCDGDYPPWLEQEMESLSPWEVIERFGRREQTSFNGSFYHLDPEHGEEIIRVLRQHGYVVEEADDLTFH